MPYFIAEYGSDEQGNLSAEYFTEYGTSPNPENAKIYEDEDKKDAEAEVIERDSEASVIFFRR